MKLLKLIPLTILLFFFVPDVFAQQVQTMEVHPLEVKHTYATYLGAIKPLRDLPQGPATDLDKRKEWKKETRTVPNFIGRGVRPVPMEGALPLAGDKMRQTYIGQAPGSHAPPNSVEPLVNVDGLGQSDSGAQPPDPAGDIGLNYYVQAINATVYRVFDKNGEAVSGNINANTLWNEIGFSSAGDPIILFDQEVNRWLITEFAPPGPNQLLVAVSDTDDPLGSYKAWNFATPNFPDYPKYSIWSDALVVTSNEQGPANLPSYFINKEQLYAGVENVDVQRIVIPGHGNGPGFQVATPVDWTGNAPPANDRPLITQLADDAWATGEADHIEIWEFDIDWIDPSNTTSFSTMVFGEAFDTNPCSAPGAGFACIPQPNGNGIDGLPEVIMNKPEYRNFGSHESIVLNFTVDATGSNLAGIRWMEIRRVGEGDWTVYQEGTFAPEDGLHRFMGACGIDGAGNIGLAYSVSSIDEFPGLRFTGRLASDQLGVMTVDEFVLVEGGSNNLVDRYGDYAAISVDPVDQRTFWFTGQYRGNVQYETRIASFAFERDSIDIGANRMLNPLSSDELALGNDLVGEVLRMEVKNFGLTPQSNFSVGFIDEDGVEFTQNVNVLIEPDSVYVHTFPQAVYIENVGDHDFKLFTTLTGDMAIFNDTLNTSITKFPRIDLAIAGAESLPQSVCEDAFTAQIVLRNGGLQEITTFDFQTTINGVVGDVQVWNGNLDSGASIFRNVFISDLLPGENEVRFEVLTVNNEIDEVSENNILQRNIFVIDDPVIATMQFTTDDFPAESSWELFDENGNSVAAGGGFTQQQTTFETEICLSLSQCYELVVMDTFGDGITFNGVDGDYQIVNEDGEVLASILELNFGTIETNAFCAEVSCVLSAEASAIAESEAGESDGIIILNLNGGVGPFQYSIDGGDNFSGSNVFNNLEGGTYDIVITDSSGDDCSFEQTVEVPTCNLTLDIVEGDGSLTINATNNNGVTQYSIDGGANFQTANFFDNLEDGAYTVVVIDNFNCSVVESTSIGMTGIEDGDLSFSTDVIIMPNPNEGAFQVVVKGLAQTDVSLPYQIVDIQGKRIRNGELTWYSGEYLGMASIAMAPAGIYFLKFVGEDFNRVVRIVKK